MSFDWKKTLGTVAPVLATALGGPMAGMAAKMAAEALGLKGGTEDDLAAAVMSGDPSTFVKLKEVDAQLKIELKRLGVDLERIHAADRASARGMGIAKGLVGQVVLSVIFVCGFVATLYAMFGAGVEIPSGMKEPAMILLGILSAGVTQIMNFWFGSSAGSKEKTRQMML